MIKDKIKYLIKDIKKRNMNEFMKTFRVSSNQALNTKFVRNQFSIEELIELCDELDVSLQIKDNKTRRILITFDKEDLKKDS